MKNKTVKALALLMTVTTVSMMGASSIYASDTETTTEAAAEETEAAGEESADADQQAADNVAALIDKIYVQERTETTDDDCKAAKEAWDALTDAQKELVEGENASPDYFGLDTGDAGGGLGKLIGRIWMHKSANAGINWDCGLAAVLLFCHGGGYGEAVVLLGAGGCAVHGGDGDAAALCLRLERRMGRGGCLLCGE